jgi:membrane protease YdiL (CAAX protease family)
LRRRTNSLMPSLVSHIVNNGFAVLSAAYLSS